MRIHAFYTTIAAIGLALTMGRTASAQPKPDETPVVKFDVAARSEPTPALRYRLLPPYLDLKPGNAALVYAKITVQFEALRGKKNSEIDSRMGAEWLETPVEKLPRDQVESDLAGYSHELAEADRAARMESCDWQLAIRTEEPWAVRLPEVQGMRQIARILAVKARLQIHDRKYDEAVRTLQTGFAMARHVAEGPTLVNGLVGVAIAGIMLDQVEALTRAPDAPNMYWALMVLPRPLIDLRLGLSAETHFVDFALPGVQDPHHLNYTADQWRELVNKIDNIISEMNDGQTAAEQSSVLSTLFAVRTYPIAKQALIAQGLSPEAVDKMPVPQVVALHKLDEFYRLRDNLFKWMYLPVWQQEPGSNEAEDALAKARETFDGFPLTELLPGIRQVSFTMARLERRIAAIAAVNALRIHAAVDGGKLPATLAEIKRAPVLMDPTTGQPFGYSVKGATATLTSSPLTKLPPEYAKLQYEITITP